MRPDRAVIGCVGIDESDGGVELGYWIARQHWGHGYATEAARGADRDCTRARARANGGRPLHRQPRLGPRAAQSSASSRPARRCIAPQLRSRRGGGVRHVLPRPCRRCRGRVSRPPDTKSPASASRGAVAVHSAGIRRVFEFAFVLADQRAVVVVPRMEAGLEIGQPRREDAAHDTGRDGEVFEAGPTSPSSR